MRRAVLIVLSALLIPLGVLSAGIRTADATDVSGTQTGLWSLAGSPYVVTGDVTVPDGETLSIEAGVVVRFTQYRYLHIYGTLVANGVSANHITFTSNQGTPTPGYWRSLNFNDADAGCILNYCDVSYGGYGSQGNVYIASSGTNVTISNSTVSNGSYYGINCYSTSSPAISSCTIQNNASYGIYCQNSNCKPTITDCTINNNGSYAIRVYADSVEAITGAMSISGNNPNAIQINGGNVDGFGDDAATWLNHSVPYVFSSAVTVPDTKTLTLEVGNTLKFGTNQQFYIYGTLVADGTPADHITFTSAQASPAAGDWRYIYFQTPEPGCILDYCDFSYGGDANQGTVYLYQTGSNVSISNSTVTYSESYGIYCYNGSNPSITNTSILNSLNHGLYCSNSSSPALSSCTIQDNGGYGIYCDDLNSIPPVTDSSIVDNGNYAVRISANGVEGITGAMTISGNNPNAFEIPGGNIDGLGDDSATWENYVAYYRFTGTPTLMDAKTLTLEPGVTIKINPYQQFYIYGTLVADGTPADHITFTSAQASPAAGDWRYIYFQAPEPGCILDYCDFSYGGDANQGTLHLYQAGSNGAAGCGGGAGGGGRDSGGGGGGGKPYDSETNASTVDLAKMRLGGGAAAGGGGGGGGGSGDYHCAGGGAGGSKTGAGGARGTDSCGASDSTAGADGAQGDAGGGIVAITAETVTVSGAITAAGGLAGTGATAAGAPLLLAALQDALPLGAEEVPVLTGPPAEASSSVPRTPRWARAG